MHDISTDNIVAEVLSHGDINQTIEHDGEQYILQISLKPFEGKWYRNREWLVDNYINKNRTMADIAEKANVTPATINQWLVKHEIPTRGRGRRQ